MAVYDLIIKNGLVCDGSGTVPFRADIGVIGGKIAFVGDISDADAVRTVDASGMIVSPGFIDAHSHNDGYLFHDPSAISKLSQGVTTEISGNCGEGLAPINPEFFPEILAYYRPYYMTDDFIKYTTFGKFLDDIEALPLGINVGFYAAHGTLRMSAMGCDQRPPTAEELEKMKTYLREALDSGALGMSTGLVYAPGCYAETEEIIELAKILKEYDAIYATHMRSESLDLMEAIDEVIRIAKETGVRVNISHLKALGKPRWGLAKEILEKIRTANSEGCRISFDQYAYTVSCNVIAAILPIEYAEGGVDKLISRLEDPAIRQEIKEKMLSPVYDWDNPVITYGYEGIHILTTDETMPEVEGKTLQEAADEKGMEPLELLFDIIVKSKGYTLAAYDAMDENDVKLIMKEPIGSVCTDGIAVFPNEKTHPRLYGGFPRVLRKYVREEKVLTLEEAVRKMTSLTAESVGLKGKGLIKEGYDADFVIFDPDTIADTATLESPQERADGIYEVIVGGKTALKNKSYTGSSSGRLIRRS